MGDNREECFGTSGFFEIVDFVDAVRGPVGRLEFCCHQYVARVRRDWEIGTIAIAWGFRASYRAVCLVGLVC